MQKKKLHCFASNFFEGKILLCNISGIEIVSFIIYSVMALYFSGRKKKHAAPQRPGRLKKSPYTSRLTIWHTWLRASLGNGSTYLSCMGIPIKFDPRGQFEIKWCLNRQVFCVCFFFFFCISLFFASFFARPI